MRYFIAICSALALSLGAQMAVGQATTVQPIDHEVVQAEMATVAVSHLQITAQDVSELNVLRYHADHIWMPLYPRGEEANATFAISYERDETFCIVRCYAEVDVQRIYNYGEFAPRYRIQTSVGPHCGVQE